MSGVGHHHQYQHHHRRAQNRRRRRSSILLLLNNFNSSNHKYSSSSYITRIILVIIIIISFFIIIISVLFVLVSSTVLSHANSLGRRCSYPPITPTMKASTSSSVSDLKIAMVSFSSVSESVSDHGDGEISSSDQEEDEIDRDRTRRRRIVRGSRSRSRSFKGLMEVVGGNKRSYADRMGYHFIDATSSVDPHRPPSWSKITALLSYFNFNTTYQYHWLFWIDADTVVANPNISLENILKAAVGHLDFHASPDLVVTEDVNGVNAGVFFIRRSEWSKQFLGKWWNQTSFIQFGSSKSGDNAAMKHLIYGLSPEEHRNHVRITPMQCLFNSYPWNPTWKSAYRLISSPQSIWKGTYSKGDFLVHLAGFDDKREWAIKVLQDIETDN